MNEAGLKCAHPCPPGFSWSPPRPDLPDPSPPLPSLAFVFSWRWYIGDGWDISWSYSVFLGITHLYESIKPVCFFPINLSFITDPSQEQGREEIIFLPLQTQKGINLRCSLSWNPVKCNAPGTQTGGGTVCHHRHTQVGPAVPILDSVHKGSTDSIP